VSLFVVVVAEVTVAVDHTKVVGHMVADTVVADMVAKSTVTANKELQ